MKRSLERYRIRKSGKKYIDLKHEELIVLDQLILHGTVTSFILHDLFKVLVNPSFSSTSISNRIRKFVDYNILERIEESFTINNSIQSRYYYKLGENGRNILSEILYIDPFFLEKEVPSKHLPPHDELLLSSLANDIYLQCKEHYYTFRHSKFKEHWLAYLFTRKNKAIASFLETAWVFENENHLILLILNAPISNHSSYEKIFNNVLNQFAKEVAKDDKHCIVIFSIAEHSFRLQVPSTKQQIQHIKANMPSFRNWHSNLEVYILSFERVKKRIISLLNFVDRDAGFKYSLPHKVDNYLHQIKEQGFSQQLLPIRNKIGPQTFHSLIYLEDIRNIITIPGLEGSVKTFQTLAALETQLFKSSYSYNQAPIHLIVIYPNKDDQYNDVILSRYGRNIWITHLNHVDTFAKASLKEVTLNQVYGWQFRKNVLFYKSSLE